MTNKQYSLERDVVLLYGRGTGGGNGAALTSVKGKGIASITRTGTGAHTITLADKYNGFLMFKASVIDANATPDDFEVTVVEELVATSKTIKIVIFDGGTATDLATDKKLLFQITLSNSAQLPQGY
jgi:hypothetical protein